MDILGGRGIFAEDCLWGGEIGFSKTFLRTIADTQLFLLYFNCNPNFSEIATNCYTYHNFQIIGRVTKT